MLSLELHATHQHHPEEICILVVPTSYNLVLNEGVVDLLVVSVFALVVADEHECGVEAGDEVADQEV